MERSEMVNIIMDLAWLRTTQPISSLTIQTIDTIVVHGLMTL